MNRLAKWAKKSPSKKAWTFLDDHGKGERVMPEELDERATNALASHLLSAEAPVRLKQGDRVLLVFFPGLHFMISLLSRFKAGIIDSSIPTRCSLKLKKDLHHFVSIQESSGATTALTHSAYNFAKSVAWAKNIFSFSKETWPELNWFLSDSFIGNSCGKAADESGSIYTNGLKKPLESDIAFLFSILPLYF